MSILSSVTMNFRISVNWSQPTDLFKETETSSVLDREARLATPRQMLSPLRHVLEAGAWPWRRQAPV